VRGYDIRRGSGCGEGRRHGRPDGRPRYGTDTANDLGERDERVGPLLRLQSSVRGQADDIETVQPRSLPSDLDCTAGGRLEDQCGGARPPEFKISVPSLWNWVRVTSPRDATAEDVAHTLCATAGHDGASQAYRLIVREPCFQPSLALRGDAVEISRKLIERAGPAAVPRPRTPARR